MICGCSVRGNALRSCLVLSINLIHCGNEFRNSAPVRGWVMPDNSRGAPALSFPVGPVIEGTLQRLFHPLHLTPRPATGDRWLRTKQTNGKRQTQTAPQGWDREQCTTRDIPRTEQQAAGGTAVPYIYKLPPHTHKLQPTTIPGLGSGALR